MELLFNEIGKTMRESVNISGLSFEHVKFGRAIRHCGEKSSCLELRREDRARDIY